MPQAIVDPDELRRYMRERLPDHAVPAAFVRIDEMPMAASAKADPALLPAPTRFHRRGGERVEPSNPIERRLCAIWAELLSLEAVGVTDDLTGRVSAVDLVRVGATALGGKGGGGRPDMAQAGGPEGAAAEQSLSAIESALTALAPA